MAKITKTKVSEGIFYVEIPEAGLFIQCGCPSDSVKHLMKRGIIHSQETHGVVHETGPNAILLSDVLIQNSRFSNLSEFPILQMFYRQGMLIPGHPGNQGIKPVLIGSRQQVSAQLEYIYRGNYGLISAEEMLAAGVSAEDAKWMMRLKLKFAFGAIRRLEEFLDQVVVEDEPREIRAGVFVTRMGVNQFALTYEDETVLVDLNLPPRVQYQPSYPLGYHLVKRDYFSVLHSGDGDGWDINRPAMASILIFQGRVYLIDAGPNLVHSLNALGIGVNEIVGVFHTHAHDDHFCGLATLMRADHRMKYYATPLVRASVMKKLSALAMRDEEEFAHYFDYHDLTEGVWNDIEGLEVRPINSPHPVETTIMVFRTMDREGYRTYGHFADIVSLKVLTGMITADPEAPGVSQALYDQVVADYLSPLDLKKLDIGGGMIHGDAEDFAQDRSGKIVLAHTALPLTPRQKEIGSGAPFGMLDVLIPSHQEYVRSYAFHYLAAYFTEVAAHHLRVLQNNPLVTFNPESIILKAGERGKSVFLILTGQVEMLKTRAGVFSTLSAGSLVGEHTALTGDASKETYRAASFVQALRIPRDLYAHFVQRHGLFEDMRRLLSIRAFLDSAPVFGDSISCAVQNAIAKTVTVQSLARGEVLEPSRKPQLTLIREGRATLMLGREEIARLKARDCLGEGSVLFDLPCLFQTRATDALTLYHIPGQVLADIPIVRWKLLEIFDRRLGRVVFPQNGGKHEFQWMDDYATEVETMDLEHRGLFDAAKGLNEAILEGNGPALSQAFGDFVALAESHFRNEEALLCSSGYPGCESHKKKHEKLLAELICFQDRFLRGELRLKNDFLVFLKEWIVHHILTEDRKYGPFLRDLAQDRS